MKNIKILLVDDEKDILEIVGYNLKKEGYEIITAENGLQAIEKSKKHKPDLIIMDVMMPEMDGMEACEKIRALPDMENTLITFLTARGEDYSQLAGFEAGADDYITKPVKPKVLVSKINALTRRLGNSSSGADGEIQQLGDIRIDKDKYTVYYKDQELVLPRKEFELLSLLSSKPGKVFKREEILNSVWGNEVIVGGRTIDVHMRKLREKLGDSYFKTVKGVGYKMEI